MTEQPFFSIVIPSLNEEKHLPLLLQDLVSQTFKQFEVIVIDGKSDDKTVEKTKNFSQKLALKIELSQKRNVSIQRNLGGQKAIASWIIFMDADNRLPPYFLQGIKYRLEKEPQTEFFTCFLALEKYSLNSRPIASLMNLTLQVGSYVQPFSYGAMMGLKKNIFDQHQFDPNLNYMEDYCLTRELDKAGYQFNCFKEPAYQYSLRRFKKDGLVRIINAVLSSQIQLLTQGSVDGEKLYPMNGGDYYQDQKPKLNKKFIKKTKKLLNKLLQKYES
jgi:glycosyltransferase involved in cell wall biosynthesis